jgi:hypothetical protein
MIRNHRELLALVALVLLVPGVAGAYTTYGGTISPSGGFATYVSGAEDSGDWDGITNYGYTQPSLNPTPGNAFDNAWIQDTSAGFGVWNGQGLIFDLGSAQSVVTVFPYIDHVGTNESELLEGTEFRVYGSNSSNPLGSWTAANWDAVWVDGVSAAVRHDNYVSQWSFATPYRFIGIAAGNPETGYASFDTEINAIAAPVPEPSSLYLLGGGLFGLAGVSRRLRKKD